MQPEQTFGQSLLGSSYSIALQRLREMSFNVELSVSEITNIEIVVLNITVRNDDPDK